MNETFMKEKPVFPLMLSMALPMVLSMMVSSLYNIVDSFFIAKISENAMTALSLVFPMQNFINSVCIGFGIGINAVIAFFSGAGQKRTADRAASQGFFMSLVHGAVLTVLCIAVMPRFLRMFTGSAEIVSLGVRYSNIAFAFSLIISLGMTFEKIFQSVGRMQASMVSLMCGCVANIVLDPLMIFGIGPFPAMGIEGAALATGLGQSVTLLVYLVLCVTRPLPVRITPRLMKPGRDILPRIYSIGVPAALNMALPSLLIAALNVLLASFSETYILVLGIYYKLQTFLYLPANGIVQGMRPVIGYNYGAGERARVRRIYRVALAMSGVIMAAGTLICLLVPGTLMGLFTSSEATIAAGETALRLISIGFIVSSVSVISAGALEGLGKGTQSLVISLCRFVVIIIPASFLLSHALGAVGVWHAFWISELLTAVVSLVICRRTLKLYKKTEKHHALRLFPYSAFPPPPTRPSHASASALFSGFAVKRFSARNSLSAVTFWPAHQFSNAVSIAGSMSSLTSARVRALTNSAPLISSAHAERYFCESLRIMSMVCGSETGFRPGMRLGTSSAS